MIEVSDERLALRGAEGDERAFEEIYRRYHQDLYRFCLGMLGSPHDAQDTLQNTMVKVLRALPGEKREIKLKPWLYRIARNEAVETLRRRRERVEPEPEQVAPSAAQIAERAEDRERLRRLFADLEQLPERQRGALVMRELSGLSFEEIGKAFATTAATARQTVYEARLGLRQMEEGREMRCEEVTLALSEADGRSRRRRDLRAHLRNCASCRAFAAEIDERRAELAALAPLPLAVSSGILQGVLAGKAEGAVAGSLAGGAGAGTTAGGSVGSVATGAAGKAIASSAIAKSAATVAVAAVVGVSAAGRAGLIDVPLAGRDGKPAGQAPSRASAGATAGQASSGGGGASSANGSSTATAGTKSTGASSRKAGHGSGHAAGGAPAAKHAGPASRGAGAGGHVHSNGKPHRSAQDLPPSSSHGQQAAHAHTHKPPQANASPAHTPRPTHTHAQAHAHVHTHAASGQASPPAHETVAPPEPSEEAGESGGESGAGAEAQSSLEQPASGGRAP
jgi:RNA polymerase sigma factor (sigma-70 family)